jgi:hypothetical protein
MTTDKKLTSIDLVLYVEKTIAKEYGYESVSITNVFLLGVTRELNFKRSVKNA